MPQFGEQDRVVGLLRDCFREGAEAQQQIPFLPTAGQYLLQHGEAWFHDAVLSHQLHPQARRTASFATTEGLLAGQDLQKS